MNNSFKNDILINVAVEATRQQDKVLTKVIEFDNIEKLLRGSGGTLKNEQ
ncbi:MULTISPECIES: hypothetical protein [Thermoanaerobacter]|nr:MULTISPECIES: hypothetical protein [Thermoanaerobacter]